MLIKPTLKFLKPKANIGLDEMPLLSLVLNIEFSVSGTIANPRPLSAFNHRLTTARKLYKLNIREDTISNYLFVLSKAMTKSYRL